MKKVNEEDFANKRLSSDVLWFQTILNRYNNVQAANNGIDTKTSVVLAGAITVAIFVAGMGNDINYMHIVGILFLISSTLYAIANIHLKNMHTEVSTTQEREKYYALAPKEFTWKLIADLEGSLKDTEEVNRKKAKQYKWVVYLFILGGAFILLGQAVQSINNEKEINEWTKMCQNHQDK